MVGRIYLGEFKKLFRLKSVLTMALIVALVFIITAISYNVIVVELNKVLEETPDYSLMNVVVIENREEALALIELQEEAKKEAEYYESFGMSSTYAADSNIVAIKYIMDNNLYGKEVNLHFSASNLTSGKPSAEGFHSLFMSILSLVLSIYAISVGSGIFSREIKEGTLKMMFMRPITRSAVVTAKLLASLTVVIGVYGVCSLIGYLYGLIMYGAAPVTQLLFVFNSTSAFMAPSTLSGGLQFIGQLVHLTALTLLSFTVGTLTKNRIAGMAIGLVVILGIAQLFAPYLNISAFLLSNALSWVIYFEIGAVVPKFGNFYLSIAMIFVYLVPLVVATYYVFKKRDIA